MSSSSRFLKILILTSFCGPCLTHAHDSGIKINTDLTSGIIGDVSAENSKQILGDSLNSLPYNTTTHHLSNPMVNNAAVHNQISQDDKHICTREEEYVEEVRTPSMQPVKIRTATWCMEFPPRCSNYKTEMREIIKVQVSWKRILNQT